ncbi:hypothetical protein PLESTB_001145300 [Pleodorina starrii]|uniref:NF-kappa-B inhibitor-like protein 1 n=1 Tax=Pleodorina starrii TaxID=330485 RepID=A0A9W6BRB3_9CHLO|nr:hypothetical protein PLESTM_000559000 [Pleodorina starrii]GLC56784.1 hypothetical protein PLESTB_001145300 [Pleodorina starrii]GLC66936.1 hypothetical protein PLESTF_000492200 [Pleodorina starrii]
MGKSKVRKDKNRQASPCNRSPVLTATRRRHRSRSRSRSRRADPLRFQLKALKYVTRGDARRLRKLLHHAKNGADLAAVDSQGRTILHQACACGHADVVALLLRYGALAAAVDAFGDTPAHVAARGGHLEALAEALRAPGAPPLDAAGAGGVSLRELMGAALRSGGAGGGAGRKGGEGGLSIGNRERATGHDDEAEAEDDDARWRRRLREEYSDGEGPSEDDWRGAQRPEEERAADSDDEWADRLWREMQRRRSAAAAASAAAFAADLRAENSRLAAEAAERSRRILREEQAKDAEWRRRTLLPAIEAGPSTPPLDLTAARVAYDERWEQLDREAAAAATAVGAPAAAAAAAMAPLTYWDIPWPLQPPTAAGPAPRPGPAPPPAAPPPAPSAEALRDFLLLGASGPSEVKRRLRGELLRWHPDKFGARFGGRLAAAGQPHSAAALARVHQLAQVLTQVLGRG